MARASPQSLMCVDLTGQIIHSLNGSRLGSCGCCSFVRRAHDPVPASPGPARGHPRRTTCSIWTSLGGQAWLQERSRWKLGQVLSYIRPPYAALIAAGPYGVREIGSKSESRTRWSSDALLASRSRLIDRLPLPLPCVPFAHFSRRLLIFHGPLRRQREAGRSPSSLPAPRPVAPSCWRALPPPDSSACAPTSRPATDP